MSLAALYAQAAVITFSGAALVVSLVVARRGLVAPLVILSAMILVARAGGFAISYLGSEEATPPIMQVLNDYVRSAPVAVLITYVCLMQPRRYRVARNNDWIRALFRRVPHIYGVAFLVGLIGGLIIQPPVLEGGRSIPASSFFTESTPLIVAAAYAGLAAFVFFTAVRGTLGPLGLGQRLQNLFFGIALTGLSAAPLYAAVWRGLRAFSPEVLTSSLVERLSAVEFALFTIAVVGIVLGIFCYYVQSESGRFVERFLSFLELIGDLVEELANAPISKNKLNLPYVAMHQAAGGEFLDLSLADIRRMDNAFCVKTISEHCADDGEERRDRRTERTSRRRLFGLLEAYDVELREPVLAKGLSEGICGQRLPETLRDLLPERRGSGGPGIGRQGLGGALTLALKTEETDGETDLTSSPEWEQLVYVALADAKLLPTRQREAVLNGHGISEKILDAYHLARYKIHNHREGVPRIHESET